MRIAIFGDVGGHLDPFKAGLESVGLTKNNKLPKDLVVIQVGDLVHKGPHSNELVQLVDDIIKKNPIQWIQLIGNHEGQYLSGPEFWSEELQISTLRTIRNWYVKRQALMAVGIDSYNEEQILITHAGLSPEFWTKYANSTKILREVVPTINDWPLKIKFSPGIMLGGCKTGDGGPAWAHCTQEVYEPWFRRGEMPFSQIHGHTTPYYWRNKRWGNYVAQIIKDNTVLDEEQHLSYTTLGDHRFISVDPGYGNSCYDQKVQFPFVIEGEIVL